MNLKKVALIPLMAALLVGCGTGNGGKKGDGSSQQGGEDSFDVSEPTGEAVTKDVAKQAFTNAVSAFVGQNNIGLDLTHTEVEAKYDMRTPYPVSETELGMIDYVSLSGKVSDVSLKVRAENLQSQNPNEELKASVQAGLTAEVKGKVATGANEQTGAIEYTNINLGGALAAEAYLVGNEPYVNVPESNAKTINDVLDFLVGMGLIDAEEIPPFEFPIKYHFTNIGLDLTGIKEGASEAVEGIGDIFDELDEMPAEIGTLKFIKESESKYAIYADINYEETYKETIADVEYVFNNVKVVAKALAEFDTSVGLTKVAASVEFASYTNVISALYDGEAEDIEGYSKELLESHYQEIAVKGQAQLGFVYGDNAKVQLPADLASYTVIDLGSDEGQEDGGDENPLA